MFKTMFYVSLALAVFFLIVSVVLFVRNNVAKLIGDVTGWNTKRAKKEFLRKNVAEHSKIEQDMNRASRRNKVDRKKKMPIFSEVERSLSEEEATMPLGEEATTLLNENATTLLGKDSTTLLEEETTLLAEEVTTLLAEEETTLLAEEVTTLLVEEETTLLAEEATALLAEEETTLLAEEATTLLANGATILSTKDKPAVLNNKDSRVEGVFEVEESMLVTHTNESLNQ